MKVFISHAHKDKEAAKEFSDKLKERGIQAWFDEDSLQPGAAWEDQIKEAVEESQALVVFLGDGAPSPNVLVEAGMALSQGKQVLPVVAGENAEISVFGNLQQVRAVGENGIDLAADEIASLPGNQELLL
jgi:3-hydroxyisobutyrate dehydrogenase-like beta-hydroxyacid dehydrogenase